METFGSRETNLSRVVNATPEQEEGDIEHLKNPIEKSERHYAELEKTPEEIKFVEELLKRIPKFLDQYGVEAMALSADNIHFLDIDRLTDLDRQEMNFRTQDDNGVCLPRKQFVGVRRMANGIDQAQVIVHEVLHLNAFLSATRHGDLLDVRRVGVGASSKDGEKRYFGDLDEAIISELTTRFDRKYFGKMPELAQDVRTRKNFLEKDVLYGTIRELDGKEADVVGVGRKKHDAGGFTTTIRMVGYPKQREALWEMIGKIAVLPKNKKKTKEEIFNAFAEASMTGRLLGTEADPGIARLIESTNPGKNAFREFGEQMAKNNK